ncbi:MAG TPA: MgtC/SapB family protein [Acidobacteriaceae bacterium]|nr:MgtC/SapB family protein [Acidobacteriaceae bacterium]
MILAIQTGHMLAYGRIEQMLITSGAAGRLLLAAGLGAAIGVDRELHHRPSGVRTNVLICFGAAMFTFLSVLIAGDTSPNRGQIASNIVQGIGFLGAGLILHQRDRVSGLTSAATVWAVASIGMACGAGLYVPAFFATILVLIVLELVRLLEYRANLKLYSVTYEVRGSDPMRMTLSLLHVMDRHHRQLKDLENDPIGELARVSFPVAANQRTHTRLLGELRAAPDIQSVAAFRDPEDE